MTNIGGYGDLSKLYQSQQKLNAYNDYQTKTKNGEKVEDSLFEKADANGDNKVNSSDKTAINKEIKTLNDKDTLYDFNQDGKVDAADLVYLSTEVDLDEDGIVSDAEKAFLEEQKNALIKKLEKQKDSIEADLDGDGKITINDYNQFLVLTNNRNVQESEDTVDKYLASIQKTLNLNLFNLGGGKTINLNDLATAEMRLEAAKGIVEQNSVYENLTTTQKNKSDINGDKIVDANDVKILESAITSLQQQLKTTTENLTTIQENYEKEKGELSTLKTQNSADKTEVNDLKKEVQSAEKALKTAKNNLTKAENSVTTAEKNLENAKKNLSANEKKLKTLEAQYKYYKSINNYWFQLTASNIANMIKSCKNDMDIDAKEKAIETAKAKVVTAKESVEEKNTKLAELNDKYNTASEKYKASSEALKTQEAELETATTKYKKVSTYFDKMDTISIEYGKDLAKTALKDVDGKIDAANAALKTDDAELQAAFDNMSDEEKVLINELGIDLTETFADGSHRYVIAKGAKDGQYHVYEFLNKDARIAYDVVRRYAENSYSIVKKGNGSFAYGGGTYATNGKILTVKETEKTITTKSELTEEQKTENQPLQTLITEETHAGTGKADSELQNNIDTLVNNYINGDVSNEEVLNQIEEAIKSGYDEIKTDDKTGIVYGVKSEEVATTTKLTDEQINTNNTLQNTLSEELNEAMSQKDSEIESKMVQLIEQYTTNKIGIDEVKSQIVELVDNSILTDIKNTIGEQSTEIQELINKLVDKYIATDSTAQKTEYQATQATINSLVSSISNAQTPENAQTFQVADIGNFIQAINNNLNKIQIPQPTTETVTTEKNLTNFIESTTSLVNKLQTVAVTTTTEKDMEADVNTRKYYTGSPLSFDLNGDGVKTTTTKINYDLEGDGKVDIINDSADAILVFDADKNGISGESGHELFGDNTDLDGDGEKDGFKNGFDALKALALKEGLIDDNDRALNADDLKLLGEKYGLGLKVGGYNGEVKSFAELGVTEINLSKTDETDTQVNYDGQHNDIMTQEGATFKVNGETQTYSDIWHRKYDNAD